MNKQRLRRLVLFVEAQEDTCGHCLFHRRWWWLWHRCHLFEVMLVRCTRQTPMGNSSSTPTLPNLP